MQTFSPRIRDLQELTASHGPDAAPDEALPAAAAAGDAEQQKG